MEEKRKPLFDFLRGDTPQETVSNERALLAGATPLLVGLLTGNTGDAVDVAAKGLMAEDERKLKEDNTLLDYLRKKEEKKGSDRLYQVRDKDTGDIVYRYQDEAHGQLAPQRRRSVDESEQLAARTTKAKEEILKDYGKGFQVVDDDEGRKQLIHKGGMEKPRQIFESSKPVGPKTEKYIDDQVKIYNKDVSKINESISNLSKSLSAIDKGQLGSKLAVMGLVKDIETRLSDQDRNFYKDNISIARRLQERIAQEQTGQLPPRLIKEAKQLLESSLSRSKDRKSRLRSNRIDQVIARDKSTPRDYLEERFGEYKEPEVKADMTDSSKDFSNLSPVDIDYRMQQNQKRIDELRKKLGKK